MHMQGSPFAASQVPLPSRAVGKRFHNRPQAHAVILVGCHGLHDVALERGQVAFQETGPIQVVS